MTPLIYKIRQFLLVMALVILVVASGLGLAAKFDLWGLGAVGPAPAPAPQVDPAYQVALDLEAQFPFIDVLNIVDLRATQPDYDKLHILVLADPVGDQVKHYNTGEWMVAVLAALEEYADDSYAFIVLTGVRYDSTGTLRVPVDIFCPRGLVLAQIEDVDQCRLYEYDSPPFVGAEYTPWLGRN